ncbi:hypothetical protein RD792_003680 [Penstemon davidsonii]|uniref:Ubiquitin-like domain-containing protein n=1 Tax=Penstemon davidsonii TaxID=160366 RepID=A0ABR0DFE7_9LAMI|nr:hypothetical protein RD792_003680 [Penstemon davidsonii]
MHLSPAIPFLSHKYRISIKLRINNNKLTEKSSSSSSNSTVTTESSHCSVNTHVKIRVHNGEDDRVFCFQMQRDVRLLKLMKKYGERVGVDYNTLRFSYDGRRIQGDQTAEGLELED